MRNGLFKRKDAFGSGVPLVNVADVYREDFQIHAAALELVQATPDEVHTFRVRPGDLFFVRSSLKLEGTGRCAVAAGCQPDTVFECHLVQARADQRRTSARFLAVQLNSSATRQYLISRANVVTMATIAQEVLASCPVVLPPLEEQARLLQYIDDQCVRVGTASNRADREISLLREYRTRLIADVVTGRLDVREAAAKLPDEPAEAEPTDEPDSLAEGDEEADSADLAAASAEAEA